MLKAFEKDYRPHETEYSKQQSLQLEQQKEQNAQAEAAETKENALQEQFKKWKKRTVLARAEELSTQEQTTIKKAFLEKIENSSFYSERLKKSGFENQIIQAQWGVYLEEDLLSDMEKDVE